MKVLFRFFAWFLILGLVSSCGDRFKTNFTLSTTSTNPYDVKFFYEQVKKDTSKLFIPVEYPWYLEEKSTAIDSGVVYSESYLNEPEEEVDSTSCYIAVSRFYEPWGTEITAMKEFIADGNTGLVASFNIGKELMDSLLYNSDTLVPYQYFPPSLLRDSLKVSYHLDSSTKLFEYPGHYAFLNHFDSLSLAQHDYFYHMIKIDTLISDEKGRPQILRFHIGKGKLLLCNNPLILSNYFLLHKDNYQLLNLLSKELGLKERSVFWEKFYDKRREESDDKNDSFVWRIIHEYEGLRWAFYTLLIGAILFFAMYSRRIVQQVPFTAKRSNTSLAYVRTLAGVYWNRKDHASIAQKLFHQFFEYLYMDFRIKASEVNVDSIEHIAKKTGKSSQALKHVLEALNDYNKSEQISKEQLERYYSYLTKFYKSS